MNIDFNSTQWVSNLISELKDLSISTVNQKAMIIGTSILGLYAACSWIYRASFQGKKLNEKHDPRAEEVGVIRQKIFNCKEKSPILLSPPLTKEQVINRAQALNLQLGGLVFPKIFNSKSTALELVSELYNEEIILKTLRNTQVLIPPSVSTLIDGFLCYKKKFGSKIEQQLYWTLSKPAFIVRLLIKRPIVFTGPNGSYLLRNGKKGVGGFESIGSDKESDLQLNDYLSYDEMEILALIGVSIPTHFINDGNSLNQGVRNPSTHHEKEGICLGLVGPRLELEGYMEYQHLMITWTQNRVEKGYGPLPERKEDDTAITGKMRLFATFYNIDYFPTYVEIQKLNSREDTKVEFFECDEGFIRKDLYQHRIKILIMNFLSTANEQAGKIGQKAYAQPWGWGFSQGVKYDIQYQWFIEAFLEVIEKNIYPNIADIDFSFFMKLENYSRSLEKFIEKNRETLNGIKLHFPLPAKSREPSTKLTGPDAGKLLVNSYESNGNAYCGNKYWLGSTSSSIETAMMGASPLLLFAQLPEINPYLTDSINNFA